MSHWYGIASIFRWLPFLLPSDDALASGNNPSEPPEVDQEGDGDSEWGEVLDDRFRLGKRLGAGGFGEVYRATQLSTGQQVAVKLIRPDVLRDAPDPETLRERFRRETVIVASLNHPHVVSLIDAGEAEDGRLYAAYEFVKGETLTDYLDRRGALSDHRAKIIMSQVLDALAAAHDQQVVHRDLKPDNIMLREGGIAGMTNVVVLDFGIATLQEEARKRGEYKQLTAANAMPGTPAYMSPEQVTSPTDVGPWSDVYAWGLIYCECMRGEQVYSGETAGAVMLLQASPTEVPLPARFEGTELGEIIAKATAKKHTERYQNAGEALEALSPHIPYSTQVLAAVKPSEDALPTAPHTDMDVDTMRIDTAQDIKTQRLTATSTTPLRDTISLSLNKANLMLTASGNRVSLILAILIPIVALLVFLLIPSSADEPTQPKVAPAHLPAQDPVPSTTPTQTPAATPTQAPLCNQGRVPVNGHCCWPGQRWDAHEQVCSGAPKCPMSTMQRPASCIPLNSRDLDLLERCKPFDDEGDTTACQILATHLNINKEPEAAADVFRVACARQNGPGCTGAAGALRKLNRHEEARQLLKIGCDLNHANACHTLGWDYQYGRHVARDWSLAESLYQQACGPGDPFTNSCQALARHYLKQARQAPDNATAWLDKAKIYLRRCASKRPWCELTLSKLNKDSP